MEKNIKKILYLTCLSSLLITSCKKKHVEKQTKVVKQTMKTYSDINETVKNIMLDYVDQCGNIYSYNDFAVDKFYDVDYLYKKDNKYIYDYHLDNVPGYEHIKNDDIYMYVIKVEIDDIYVPVAGVVNIDNNYYDVFINTYEHIDHNEEKDYVRIQYIDEDVINDLEEASLNKQSKTIVKKKTY